MTESNIEQYNLFYGDKQMSLRISLIEYETILSMTLTNKKTKEIYLNKFLLSNLKNLNKSSNSIGNNLETFNILKKTLEEGKIFITEILEENAINIKFNIEENYPPFNAKLILETNNNDNKSSKKNNNNLNRSKSFDKLIPRPKRKKNLNENNYNNNKANLILNENNDANKNNCKNIFQENKILNSENVYNKVEPKDNIIQKIKNFENIIEQKDKEIVDLKVKIKDNNYYIDNYVKEIKELENKYSKKDSELIELKNKFKNLNNKIKNLNDIIESKEKEILELNNEIKNIKEKNTINEQSQIFKKKDMRSVNFILEGKVINYSIPCIATDIFALIEEKLYNKYPNYRETNNIFYSIDNKPILRFKTIKENNIGNGLPVKLVIPKNENKNNFINNDIQMNKNKTNDMNNSQINNNITKINDIKNGIMNAIQDDILNDMKNQMNNFQNIKNYNNKPYFH